MLFRGASAGQDKNHYHKFMNQKRQEYPAGASDRFSGSAENACLNKPLNECCTAKTRVNEFIK